MQEHTQRAYRKMLAWLGFAFLWLLMPAIIIWALVNLVAGTRTYERDTKQSTYVQYLPSAANGYRDGSFYQQTSPTL